MFTICNKQYNYNIFFCYVNADFLQLYDFFLIIFKLVQMLYTYRSCC